MPGSKPKVKKVTEIKSVITQQRIVEAAQHEADGSHSSKLWEKDQKEISSALERGATVEPGLYDVESIPGGKIRIFEKKGD